MNMYELSVIVWMTSLAFFSLGVFCDMTGRDKGTADAAYYSGMSLAGIAVLALSVNLAMNG